MYWAIGIDMYTLMCIKLMTNKNLLYKKINKIKFKFKNKKKEKHISCFLSLFLPPKMSNPFHYKNAWLLERMGLKSDPAAVSTGSVL